MSVGHTQQQVQIRWMIRRDMAEVLEIERESFEFPWSEEDFLACLRQRNCIGMVAECDDRIVGFMIYELQKSQLHVLNFAVSGNSRRQGVGTLMVEKLVNKLSQQRRDEICLEVRESNLMAQVFFRSLNFRAVCVLRNHYIDTAEDAYAMRYQLVPSEAYSVGTTTTNRISQYRDAA